ncbi:GNAT family N-acetyltransferase [Methylomagnum sp.]
MLSAKLSAALPEGFTLRVETPEDFDFVTSLYASVREEELSVSGWSDDKKQRFIRWQSGLQRDHYRRHYPDAWFWILEQAGTAMGRLYVDLRGDELRLMEITWLTEWRNRGLGTAIIRILMDFASEQGLFVSLHVEPNNPAQSLYRRFGFQFVEDRGAYQFLHWHPPGKPDQ